MASKPHENRTLTLKAQLTDGNTIPVVPSTFGVVPCARDLREQGIPAARVILTDRDHRST